MRGWFLSTASRWGGAEVTLTELQDDEDFEKEWLGSSPPLRNDFEGLLEDKGFVEVEIEAED